MRRSIVALAISAAAVLAVPSLAGAAPKPSGPPASCSVSGTTVNAVGLPTDQVINMMATDNSGTSAWVLGYTPDGTWSATVATPDGSATYQFISRTWGPGGSKYNVFATCWS